MPFILSIVTAVFVFKGLGGSFHALITQLGWVFYHGAIVGGLSSLLLMVCFYLYATGWDLDPKPVRRIPNPAQKIIVSLLFLVLMVAAVRVRVEAMRVHPLDVRQADMLPLVRAGLEVAAGGHSPYRGYVLEDGSIHPGYYLPSLWMVYMPAQWLGIDIRWTTIVAQLIFYLVLLQVYLSRRSFAWSYTISSGLFLGLIALHAFSKLAIGQVTTVHTAGFSLLLTLFLWSVWRKVKWLPAVFVPLLVLSRELAILYTLPLGISLWLNDRTRFWRYLLIIAVIGFGISLPFWIPAGSQFFAALKFYAGHTQGTTWETMMQYYGWCGFLKRAGITGLQPVLQLSGLALSAFLLFKGHCRKPLQVLALGGLTVMPFLLFVSITWGYLFIEPLILLYFLTFARDP